MEHSTQARPYEPNTEPFGEDITGARLAPYAFGRPARTDYSRNSVPLFLSDPDGDPDPQEYANPLQPRRKARISSRLLMATVAAASLATLYAMFSSDASRDFVVNAKASIAAVMPAPSEAAQPASTQLTPHDIQLKDPARVSNPAFAAADTAKGPAMAALNPTREEITTAYQSALQGRAPAVAAPVAAAPTVVAPAVAAAPVRRIDPEEFATLMQRAKALLATGDIPSARLLLERAAEAPDANAALMLAQTYDPEVLGTPDIRNIIPEPAKARALYQKAAQLGSADAQRRLAQLQN